MSRTFVAALLLAANGALADTVVLEGEIPDGGSAFQLIPFAVPAGISEIEVRHDDLSSANTLDFGLEGPDGFRGWGGDNPEPIIVGAQSASRSYTAGPISPGTWNVLVGLARIRERPVKYRLEIDLRAAPTLGIQPGRGSYVPAKPLSTEARWYAGDFHVHSLESGDARPTLDAIADLARGRGIDFVAISDHNTRSHLDFLTDAQSRHPNVLLVPSVEFTTYKGHGNAFGSTGYVDHKLGFGGVTFEAALAEYAQQGAIFTINHPTLDIGSGCIGCGWELPVPRTGIGAIEIGVGGWDETGALFDDAAIAFWDRLSALGLQITPVGGSDDHRAGVNMNQTQSPIGDPTTMVFAKELSVAGLIEGVRDGRTVVKLRGPEDPMIVLDATGARQRDTIVGDGSAITVTVTGGQGHELRFVRDGQPLPKVTIDADPFTAATQLEAPADGASRIRAEVLVSGRVRTVTANLWVSRVYPITGAIMGTPTDDRYRCAVAGGALFPALLALGWMLMRRRRRD